MIQKIEIEVTPQQFRDAIDNGQVRGCYINNIGYSIGRYSHKAWLYDGREIVINDTDVKLRLREN